MRILIKARLQHRPWSKLRGVKIGICPFFPLVWYSVNYPRPVFRLWLLLGVLTAPTALSPLATSLSSAHPMGVVCSSSACWYWARLCDLLWLVNVCEQSLEICTCGLACTPTVHEEKNIPWVVTSPRRMRYIWRQPQPGAETNRLSAWSRASK